MSRLTINDINNVVEQVDKNMEYFSEIGTPIIDFYSSDLDEFMGKVKEFLDSSSPQDLNINELQYYFMQLTSLIYTTSSNVEKVGLLMDLSNMTYKDAFNTSLLNKSESDTKLTVAKLQAIADKEALPENTLNFIYSRTYKILKAKLDSANEMIRTLSKIISYKMQMNQISNEDRFDVNTKQLLLERGTV